MRHLKVLYGIGGLGSGGAERQLLYLVRGIAARVSVTVLTLSRTAIELRPEFESLPGVRVLVSPKRSRFDPTLLPRLVWLLRRERPDIVHSYLRTANYWIRLAAILARVPIRVASERNIEVERGPIANYLDRLLALGSERIVVNAEAIRDRLISMERIPPERIDVIWNGVPAFPEVSAGDRAMVREEMRLGKQPLIGFIGRLVPQKNPRLFLDMARRLLAAKHQCHFALIGDGPLRGELEAEVETAGLGGAVHFLGHRSDVPRLLKAIDVLTLTSDWEGLPNVVLEALAMGVPAVATDVGGVREVVKNGVNGFVVPAGNASVLSRRVASLLEDPKLRVTFGRRGKVDVMQRFSLEQMIVKTVQLYESLVR